MRSFYSRNATEQVMGAAAVGNHRRGVAWRLARSNAQLVCQERHRASESKGAAVLACRVRQLYLWVETPRACIAARQRAASCIAAMRRRLRGTTKRTRAKGHPAFSLPVQELYRWPAVQEAAAAALDLRYRLLPYFYTLAQNASETGHPLLRPLWMNFPRETQTKTIDRHALLCLLA